MASAYSRAIAGHNRSDLKPLDDDDTSSSVTVPLGFVSLTGNLMMVDMAVWMTLKRMGTGH